MNLDSFFLYGFRNFLIVVAFTTVICTMIWLTVDKNVDRFNKSHPGQEVPRSFVVSAVRFAYTLFGILIVVSQIPALKPLLNMMLGASGVLILSTTIAAKETLNNYIAGFMLSNSKPFKVGDTICVKEKGIAGTVETITFRHTQIRTESGSVVTIPNATMNSVSIENLSEVEQ